MVDIECLVCGKDINIPKYIDTDDYDGQVVCQECTSLLHVKLVKGQVQKYKVVEDKSKAFNFTKLIMELKEKQNKQEKDSSDRG